MAQLRDLSQERCELFTNAVGIHYDVVGRLVLHELQRLSNVLRLTYADVVALLQRNAHGIQTRFSVNYQDRRVGHFDRPSRPLPLKRNGPS